jgi:hypothetical protein
MTNTSKKYVFYIIILPALTKAAGKHGKNVIG